MKSIWLVLSMLALANILALAGLVGWLAATDRLSDERVQRVRELFARPVAIEHAERVAIEVAAEQAADAAAQAERLAQPPLPAAERLARDQAEAELDLQRMLRRKREIDDLGAQLVRRQDELDRREKELNERIAAFETAKQRYLEIEGAAQFQAALETLEGLRPRDAKATLEAMMAQGLTDEVIAYLSRMDEKKRSGVMAEFAKEQPTVAADLLERLRTRGVSSASLAAAPPAPRSEQPPADGPRDTATP